MNVLLTNTNKSTVSKKEFFKQQRVRNTGTQSIGHINVMCHTGTLDSRRVRGGEGIRQHGVSDVRFGPKLFQIRFQYVSAR